MCEVTQASLQSKNNQCDVELLILLRGVGGATTSTNLPWCYSGNHSILDFCALWSLTTNILSQYDFSFWSDCVSYVRQLAADTGLSIPVIDLDDGSTGKKTRAEQVVSVRNEVV